MSEYIGSRIALISKSDIKYIGTLHEINSDTATVALENVRSHGTEGRRTGVDEIPPSDTIYEYIVFRGSDVKELSIVEAPKENKTPAAVPNDPAILGSARPAQYQPQPPPQQQQQQQPQNHFQGPQYQPQFDYQHGPPQQYPPPRFQGPGGPHGFPGQPGAVPGYNPAFGPPPPHFGAPGYGPPPGAFGQHPPPGAFPPQNPIGPPGQRPQQDQQPRPQQKPAEMSGTPAPAANAATSAAPPPPVENPVTTAQAAATAAATTSESEPVQRKAPNNRVAVPLRTAAKPPQKPAESRPAPPSQPQSYADATSAATAAVAEAMAKLNTGAAPRQERAPPADGQRGRGRGRGTAPPRGGRREQQPQQPQRGVEVPKEDFDFQTANAKFNKDDLVKQAIATGSPSAHTEQDNPLENGHGEADDVVIPPRPVEKGYDKKTSFFDDISSDLKDRNASTGFDGRTMRREERSKNMETFGQGSVDGGRGGFRGRGRGRGRGQGFGRGRGRGPAETAALLAATT